MGLFGPSKAEKAEQQRIEKSRAEHAAASEARVAAMIAESMQDSPLKRADKERFQAEFQQWLEELKAYQHSTKVSRLTDDLVVTEKVMPLPSTRGLSRMGASGHLAEMRAWANIVARSYAANTSVAEGGVSTFFWQDVKEYVEGALLQRGL